MRDEGSPAGENPDEDGTDQDDRQREEEEEQGCYPLAQGQQPPAGMAFESSSTEEWNCSQIGT